MREIDYIKSVVLGVVIAAIFMYPLMKTADLSPPIGGINFKLVGEQGANSFPEESNSISAAYCLSDKCPKPSQEGLMFDGEDDAIKIAPSSLLHSDLALTLSIWIKPESAQNLWQTILWKGNVPEVKGGYNREYALFLHKSGKIYFDSTPTSLIGTKKLSCATPEGSVLLGKMTNVVAVIDSPNKYMKIYIDGKEKARCDYSSSNIRKTLGIVRIGGDTAGGAYFKGLIKDFRFYPRVLPDDEIKEMVSFCGDGVVDSGEMCDDGNNIDVDGCSSVCKKENVMSKINPIISGNYPDPSVLRIENGGKAKYYLVATSHDRDIPIFTSANLIDWTAQDEGAFGTKAEGLITLNKKFYCNIWAPQITKARENSYVLSFSAVRLQKSGMCGQYNQNSGVFMASSPSLEESFISPNRMFEPAAIAAPSNCDIRGSLAHSTIFGEPNCQGQKCNKIIKLDPETFKDLKTGRVWMAYSWFTNTPPLPEEKSNHGQHVSIVELNPNALSVKCDANNKVIDVGNPHDTETLEVLKNYCPRCSEMLSSTKNRAGNDIYRNGVLWGINEGSSMFRRGNYVYMLMSMSTWDSEYYSVYWVGAPSVEQLAYNNPERLEGRYIIPSQGQSFGHGSAVLGPDGESWYYVYHHLDAKGCRESEYCAREVYLSKIEFEGRGDGKGEVYIKPIFPAEQLGVNVAL